jgi:hypothetical protein
LYFRNCSIGSHWFTTMPQGGAQWWRPLSASQARQRSTGGYAFGLASEATLQGPSPTRGIKQPVTVTCCDSPPSFEAAVLESGAAGGLAVWEYALTLNRNASSKVVAWHILTAGCDSLGRKTAERCPFLIIMFPSVRISAHSRESLIRGWRLTGRGTNQYSSTS